ncbi:hypothetical protein ANN_24019 [Periplaneta americana]|uniref:RNase H type-1 domain-containing protein n=1 Tax=Periplaneta americana TaxID=6978 RepID=A0ABQ8S259_PERAM|nr:hypothetical protein ANN_24019 [Periplaneta americana]
MVGLCEGGNEPPGSSKANKIIELQSWKGVANGVSGSEPLIQSDLSSELSVKLQRAQNMCVRYVCNIRRNGSNHNNLIEGIRTNLRLVENDRWLVDFGWVKAHVGNYGNELADRLAKQAASDVDLQICYDKVPMSEVRNQLVVISKGKWESEWSTTSKGTLTKAFFPSVQDRLKLKIEVTPNLTTLLTGHGRLNAYFHRFKIKNSATCVCGDGDQTVDHIIYDCTKLGKERRTLIQSIHKCGGKWPADKTKLVKSYVKYFIKFANSIDFEQVQ